MGGVTSIGSEFYRQGFPFRQPFQSLKTLKFEAMSLWELWITVEVEALLPLTSKHCVLKLENCDKVQTRTDDDQTVAPHDSPSIMHQEQDDNKEEPISGENGNQQIPSSSSDFSSMRVAQNQTVAPEVSPSTVHQEQNDNQEKPLAGEDRTLQFSSSSLNVSSMETAELIEQPTDSHGLRIEERRLSNFIVGHGGSNIKELGALPDLDRSLSVTSGNELRLEWDGTNNPADEGAVEADLELSECQRPAEDDEIMSESDGEVASQYFSASMSEISSDELPLELDGTVYPSIMPQEQDDDQAVEAEVSPSIMPQEQDDDQEEPLSVLESLPVEGLPSGPVILCISFCDKITPQRGWKLDQLQSLYHFEIEGGCLQLESFPEEGLLPTNLNSLRVSSLLNLTFLNGKGLQNLTSLRKLAIHYCNKLDSLPEHMPSSLSSLSITDCSLLNPKLQSRKGK
ncbi:hypothetical protein PTKIN_Ptkin16aG0018700 [Pterospermum kingtungense]